MRRLLLATATLAAIAGPALADCQKLGFSVNDYGKEGPIRDAKALLDVYIKDWAAKNGIAKYRTGKKDVSCELFIDVGLFDEHTCKATATVCWNKADKKSGPIKVDGAGTSTAKAKAKAKSSKPKSADKPKTAPAKKPAEPKV